MQLFAILLVAVSILAILSGVAIFAGAEKKERPTAGWFFGATVGASLWAVAIALFMMLQPGSEDSAPLLITLIFSGSVLMDIALLGHASWDYKIGRVLTVVFALVGAGLVGIMVKDPSLLYSGFSLNYTSNTIYFLNDWYFWSYGGYIGVMTMLFSSFLFFKIARNKNKKQRTGQMLFLGGLSLTGGASLVFDLIFPIALQRCDLLWVGPLAISITVLTFYYTILHFRVLSLNSRWLKKLSFVILIISAIVVYLVIFFALFSALFRTSTPSFQVVSLNFLMAIIVLLLLPAFSELYAASKSIMDTHKIDVAYIIKKLSKVSRKKDSFKDIAGFLADHLHFSYVGFLINGRLYGSSSLSVSAEDLVKIGKIKASQRDIWQNPDEATEKVLNDLNITAIAELRDKNGKMFGQFILGKSLSKAEYKRRDLIQLEMIINLVATVVD